jgi:hypothetical protein
MATKLVQAIELLIAFDSDAFEEGTIMLLHVAAIVASAAEGIGTASRAPDTIIFSSPWNAATWHRGDNLTGWWGEGGGVLRNAMDDWLPSGAFTSRMLGQDWGYWGSELLCYIVESTLRNPRGRRGPIIGGTEEALVGGGGEARALRSLRGRRGPIIGGTEEALVGGGEEARALRSLRVGGGDMRSPEVQRTRGVFALA